MYLAIDKAKLADVQCVADKLAQLPEKALVYIAGYVEGALDSRNGNTQQALTTASGNVCNSA